MPNKKEICQLWFMCICHNIQLIIRRMDGLEVFRSLPFDFLLFTAGLALAKHFMKITNSF